MPVKIRVAKERRQSFSPEILALFAELEAVPARRRDEAWQSQSRRLAEMLGVETEWFCSGQRLDVLNRGLARYKSPSVWGGEPRMKVMGLREALLTEVARRARLN
jgi:hypothetical protein